MWPVVDNHVHNVLKPAKVNHDLRPWGHIRPTLRHVRTWTQTQKLECNVMETDSSWLWKLPKLKKISDRSYNGREDFMKVDPDLINFLFCYGKQDCIYHFKKIQVVNPNFLWSSTAKDIWSTSKIEDRSFQNYRIRKDFLYPSANWFLLIMSCTCL